MTSLKISNFQVINTTSGLMTPSGRTIDPQIIKSNSCVSATMDDFEKILTRILTDKKFKDELIERGTEFSTNYLSNMGSASQHLLDFLENPEITNDKKSLNL